jgi:hypothetical protein
MRKLTVKNLSVIKDAKLEFGKITVLIGPQASGKSLLCKLAFFLARELVTLAADSILNGNSWDEYLQAAHKDFLSRFSLGKGVASQDTNITFSSHEYEVSIVWGDDPNIPRFQFGEMFRQQYNLMLNGLHEEVPTATGAYVPGGIGSATRREDIWVALNRIVSGPVLDGVVYIPSGRSFFANASKGIAALRIPGIDSITREFSGHIQWDPRWKIGLTTTGRGVTDEINRSMTNILQGFVVLDSGVPHFLASDGRKLTLDALSTGLQELTPLFNVLEQLIYFREHSVETDLAADYQPRPEKQVTLKPFLYLEEPEASIFPSTQYELVKLFAWLASDPILDFDWVITTHSPYILTAFNNLIEAGQVARAKPELKDEVAKLIPEQYWIREGDFKAYAIEDGVLKSIVAEDTGLVSANYLDKVSETIGMEFDELLRLGYVES